MPKLQNMYTWFGISHCVWVLDCTTEENKFTRAAKLLYSLSGNHDVDVCFHVKLSVTTGLALEVVTK